MVDGIRWCFVVMLLHGFTSPLKWISSGSVWVALSTDFWRSHRWLSDVLWFIAATGSKLENVDLLFSSQNVAICSKMRIAITFSKWFEDSLGVLSWFWAPAADAAFWDRDLQLQAYDQGYQQRGALLRHFPSEASNLEVEHDRARPNMTPNGSRPAAKTKKAF